MLLESSSPHPTMDTNIKMKTGNNLLQFWGKIYEQRLRFMLSKFSAHSLITRDIMKIIGEELSNLEERPKSNADIIEFFAATI